MDATHNYTFSFIRQQYLLVGFYREHFVAFLWLEWGYIPSITTPYPEFRRFPQAWINFYNQLRPHEGSGNISPQHYALAHSLESISSISLM